VTFFFDNHHSPEIVQILCHADVDAIHLREKFATGTDDVEWIPKVAEQGWILVTGDHKIARRREEKRVFQEARLITFFLSKTYNNKSRLVRIRWIINQWEKIETEASGASPGDCFEVPFKGKIKKLTSAE
jgi:predicted nuclease of predicted toxin-antitoxin system